MEVLKQFNFDFVIIAIFTFGIAFSFYRGFGRTIIRFFQLASFFLVVELLNRVLLLSNDFHRFVNFINNFIEKISKIFRLTNQPQMFAVWLIYLIIFILISILIKIIKLFIKPSLEKQIIKKPRILSRTFGSIVGLINSYLSLILIIGLGFNVIPYQNKGLTKLLMNNPYQVTSVEKYNHFRFNFDTEYKKLLQAEDYLKNSRLYSELNQIYEINERIYFIEEDLALNFNIMITTNSAKSLIQTNLPNTNLSILGYTKALLANDGEQKVYEIVLSEESSETNIYFTRLIEYFNFLVQNERYVDLFFAFDQDLSDDNFDELFTFILDENNYFNEDFEELIIDMKILEYINSWINGYISDLVEDVDTSYQEALQAVLADHQKTLQLARHFNQRFLSDFQTSELKELGLLHIYEQYKHLFSEYIKHQESLKDINSNLRLSTRIILARQKSKIRNINELDNPLIWAYLNDELLHEHSNKGVSEFYLETLIINKLYNKNETLIIDDNVVESMMGNLDKLVEENLIQTNNAQKLMKQFIISGDKLSLFDYLVMTKQVTQSGIEKLINGNYQYITIEVRKYLEQKYSTI